MKDFCFLARNTLTVAWHTEWSLCYCFHFISKIVCPKIFCRWLYFNQINSFVEGILFEVLSQCNILSYIFFFFNRIVQLDSSYWSTNSSFHENQTNFIPKNHSHSILVSFSFFSKPKSYIISLILLFATLFSISQFVCIWLSQQSLNNNILSTGQEQMLFGFKVDFCWGFSTNIPYHVNQTKWCQIKAIASDYENRIKHTQQEHRWKENQERTKKNRRNRKQRNANFEWRKTERRIRIVKANEKQWIGMDLQSWRMFIVYCLLEENQKKKIERERENEMEKRKQRFYTTECVWIPNPFWNASSCIQKEALALCDD